MPKRPRKPKPEELNEAAFRVVGAVGEAPPESPAKTPATWTIPTEEETPPPKIL